MSTELIDLIVDAAVTVGGPFDLPHSAMRFIVLTFLSITSITSIMSCHDFYHDSIMHMFERNSAMTDVSRISPEAAASKVVQTMATAERQSSEKVQWRSYIRLYVRPHTLHISTYLYISGIRGVVHCPSATYCFSIIVLPVLH